MFDIANSYGQAKKSGHALACRGIGVVPVILALAVFGLQGKACAAPPPTFTLAWSEYPSWSVFGVADEVGLLNGSRGKLGLLEIKHGVDIELKQADYDACIQMYAAGGVDAVCLTNIDAVNPSMGRGSVAFLPTSTSQGADALITAGVADVRELRGKKVFGLARSVSEYCFVRNLEVLGESEDNYVFTNKDPAAAALAMQQKQAGYDAIVVWNPFLLSTLEGRSDAKVLFDSTSIPREIIDMVVMGEDVARRDRGSNFARCVVDIFYAMNRRMEDPTTSDDTLVAIGEKFSNLGLEGMKKVVKQTAFFGTADEAVNLLQSADLRKVMKRVVTFCREHEMISGDPIVVYSDEPLSGVGLRFSTQFVREVQESY